jgi:hypothetical protein
MVFPDVGTTKQHDMAKHNTQVGFHCTKKDGSARDSNISITLNTVLSVEVPFNRSGSEFEPLDLIQSGGTYRKIGDREIGVNHWRLSPLSFGSSIGSVETGSATSFCDSFYSSGRVTP